MKAAIKKTNKKQTALRTALKEALPRLYHSLYKDVDIFDEFFDYGKNNTGVWKLISDVSGQDRIRKLIKAIHPKEYELFDKLDDAGRMLGAAEYFVQEMFDNSKNAILNTMVENEQVGNDCDGYNTYHLDNFCRYAVLLDVYDFRKAA